MIQEVLDARKQDFAKWLTPAVQKVLTGVKAMCLDYHKAARIPLVVNTAGESYTNGKERMNRNRSRAPFRRDLARFSALKT